MRAANDVEHVAPVDRGRVRMSRQRCGESHIRGAFLKVQFVPRPRSIRALACPDALVLALHSSHSYGYGFRSRAASKCTWPARSSRILGRVDDWRGSHRSRGVAVAGGFRQCQCLSPDHSPVSSRRSSHRTCGFPASGARTRSHAFAHGKSRVRTDSRRSPKSS